MRVGGTQLLHQRFCSGGHLRGIHIGQAVDHINRGINLSHEPAYLGFHASVAGKAQIHNGNFQPSTQNGRVHHPWSRGTSTLGDGGSIKHHRLFPPRWICRCFFKRHTVANTDRYSRNAVIKRQINHEFVLASGVTGPNRSCIFLARWAACA